MTEIGLGLDINSGALISIPKQWLNAGVLIAANTGAGKSNLLGLFLPQIEARGCNVWVLENYKTGSRGLVRSFNRGLVILRASDWKFNLLQVDGCDPRLHLTMAVELLIKRLQLHPRSANILHQLCDQLYKEFGVYEGAVRYPCLFDVYERVRTERLNPPAKDSILDKLGSYLTAVTPKCAAYRVGWKATDLAKFSIVFEMRGAQETVKQLYIEPLLFSIMQAEMQKGAVNKEMHLFIVFEDSQRLFDAQDPRWSDMTPADELAGVVRGSGIGICVVVQTTRGLSQRLTPNLATKFVGRLGIGADYLTLGADLSLNKDQLNWATKNLGPGVFLVQVSEGDWREPFVMKVPLLESKAIVSEVEVEESQKTLDSLPVEFEPKYNDWERFPVLRVAQPAAPKYGKGILSRELINYLADVAENPLEPLTDRDARLGINISTGHRIRDEIGRQGLVNIVAVNPGGRGKGFKLLELTSEGIDQLKRLDVKVPLGNGRGGVRHQWWCRTISEYVKTKGYKCTIEAETFGVRVDLEISRDDQFFFVVEIETSDGHEVENITKDLRVYPRVMSLLENDKRAREIRQQLDSMLRGFVVVGSVRDYAAELDHFLF